MNSREPSAILRELGLSDKEIALYLALLGGGPSGIRHLSKSLRFPRSAIIDAAGRLTEAGLAGTLLKHKKQCWYAEDPGKLTALLERREHQLSLLRRSLAEAVVELRSVSSHANVPPVRCFDGEKGIATAAREFLRALIRETDKSLRVISSGEGRSHFDQAAPEFLHERVVSAIAALIIDGGRGTRETMAEVRRIPSGRLMPTCPEPGRGSRVSADDSFMAIGSRQALCVAFPRDGKPSTLLIDEPRMAALLVVMFDGMWEKTRAADAMDATGRVN